MFNFIIFSKNFAIMGTSFSYNRWSDEELEELYMVESSILVNISLLYLGGNNDDNLSFIILINVSCSIFPYEDFNVSINCSWYIYY